MSPLLIRRATDRDIPALADVGARTFRDTYRATSVPEHVDDYADTRFTPGHIAAWLGLPEAATLVACEGEALIGYAHVVREAVPASVPDRRAVHLSRLYLLSAAQGRGYGDALLEAALAEAAALGGRSVWLGVYERNLRAIRFYERHGFQLAGTHEFEFGGAIHHDPVMIRSLA